MRQRTSCTALSAAISLVGGMRLLPDPSAQVQARCGLVVRSRRLWRWRRGGPADFRPGTSDWE